MDKQKAIKKLQEIDEGTREHWAQRMQEMKHIETSGTLYWSQREWDYTNEATECHISGFYKSAIFCYCCSVEQIIRFEYLKKIKNDYEKIEKLTLGKLIKECKNVSTICPYIDRLLLLNEIRNKVAVHPLLIDLPTSFNSEKELCNSILIKDIKTLLDLVGKIDKETRTQLDKTKLEDSQGRQFVLGNIIEGKEEVPPSMFSFRIFLEEDILKLFAQTSRDILKEVFEGLYPIK